MSDATHRNKANAIAFDELLCNESDLPGLAGDHDDAGMDIFRFDPEGRIVEHWDVLQVVPDEPTNDSSMF